MTTASDASASTHGDAAYCPLPMGGEAPPEQGIVELLAHAGTVAVVGASPNPERTSHRIAAWLMEHTPFAVYLVNPAADGGEIRGHGFYNSLADLPVTPHIVNVFRRSELVGPVATEAIEMGATALWLQQGVSNTEAANAAIDAGMTVVQNRCLKVEYSRLRDHIEAARLGA